MRHLIACVALFALASSAAACAASLDLERFKTDGIQADPGAAKAFSDLDFACKAMLPHMGEYFELRLLDKDNALKAKVVYDRLVATDFAFRLPLFVPKSNPPYRLDYWSDQNGSTTYSGNRGTVNEKDHGWRRRLEDPLKPESVPLPPNVIPYTASRYDFTFVHDTDFTDLFTDPAGNPVSFDDTLLDFAPSITGGAAYVGTSIEARVVESTTQRLVGVHRKGRAEATYTALVSGILDEQTPYDVSVYVDLDGNEQYSAGEPSWRATFTSTAAGIADVIDLATLPQTALAIPEP